MLAIYHTANASLSIQMHVTTPIAIGIKPT
jgi:hypothetical protein